MPSRILRQSDFVTWGELSEHVGEDGTRVTLLVTAGLQVYRLVGLLLASLALLE
jgi:hypothetical protein